MEIFIEIDFYAFYLKMDVGNFGWKDFGDMLIFKPILHSSIRLGHLKRRPS